MNHLYMTPREFTELCVKVAEEIGYMKGDTPEHPGDTAVNLSVVMQSVAAGIGVAIRKEHALRANATE